MPELDLNNLRLGQRADGGLREDALLGLRRLINWDFVWGGESVKLQIRPGFERWNTVALPAVAEQLRVFVDLQERVNLLVNCNDLWYNASETIAHDQVSTFAATPPKPVVFWGDRVILGTNGAHVDDPGMIWSTHDDLAGATISYRLGIKKPDEPPHIGAVLKEGHTSAATATGRMNQVTQHKLAIKFTPVSDMEVRDVFISVRRFGLIQSGAGSWRMQVEQDSAGEPSGTRLETSAVTDWRPVAKFTTGAAGYFGDYKQFRLNQAVTLTGGTSYWWVLEANAAYYADFQATGATDDYYAAISLNNSIEYGASLVWNSTTGIWSPFVGLEAIHFVGGLWSENAADGPAYDYVYTLYNSTHLIESRPSEPARVKPANAQGVYIAGYAAITDQQVDTVRIYRRELDNVDVGDDDIVDTYKHVMDLVPGNYAHDSIATDLLGAELQTQDHFCLDDTEETTEEEGVRKSVILPTCACMWKGRLWVGEDDNNALKYSKVFEEDGATSTIGLSSIDFFPLDNTLRIPEPAHPINIFAMANDQLVVHMSNDTSYIIYGGDQSLNPPVDFTIRPYLHSNASFGIWCGSLWGEYHVYLSRKGLYRVAGYGASARPEFLSEENQSILDAVETPYLRNSILLPVGNEFWSLIDFDNDGTLDTLLIVDLQRDVPSRTLYDSPWKMRQYSVGLNDIDVVSGGDDFQQVYAADAVNAYILELDQGSTDNGTGITGTMESHDLEMLYQSMIHQVDIDAWYPVQANCPTYTYLLTSHSGRTVSGTFRPDPLIANEDIRGHRMGMRLRDAISVRLKLTQVSVQQDEIRGLLISYGGE